MSTTESGRRTFRSRLNEMIDQLRDGIATGKYKHGTYLPPEKTLAAQFRLSNKTVRKGLELLMSEGLIEKIPRVGSMVTAAPLLSVAEPAVTIVMGCYSTHEKRLILSPLLDDFHKLHPSIRVEVVALHSSSQFMETLRPCLDNALLDVFTVRDWHFSEIADGGFTDLLLPRVGSEQYYPFLAGSFTCGGVLYAEPLSFSPVVLAYNRKHFREAGLMEPDAGWTWDIAVENAAKLTVPGQRFGLHFQVHMDDRWPIFLLQSGQRLPSGTPQSGERRKVENWMSGIRISKDIIGNQALFPHPLYGSDNDIGTLFMQERTSMIMTGYESLNRFAATGIEYDISSVPYISDPRTLMTVTGVAVNKQSKHRAEAECLAAYLASPRAQRLLRERTLCIPALKPAAEAPVAAVDTLNRPSRFQLYRDIIPSFRKLGELQLPPGGLRPLHEAMKDYWTDSIDETALRVRLETILSAPADFPVHS